MPKRPFIRKNRGLLGAQAARQGIMRKRIIMRPGMENPLDLLFVEKPALRGWISKMRKLILDLPTVEDGDIVIRFMNRVRKALWYGPSEYEKMLHQHIMLEGDLSA